MYVDSCLCADLFEEDIILFSQFFTFCFADVPIFKVNFVGEECNYDSLSSLVFDIVDPLLNALICIAICDIVDNYSHGGISNVIRYQSLESLLSGCVPELESDGFILKEDVLRDEVDADGGSLHGEISTCSLPSNIS